MMIHVCTADDPWTPAKGERAEHPMAREEGDQQNGYPGGDIVTYVCPHCKHRWTAELPQ